MEAGSKIENSWIRLARSVSPGLFWKLLASNNRSPEEALKKVKKPYSMMDLCLERETAAKNECHWVLYDHSSYPPLLKTMQDPPPLLLVRGNLKILQQKFMSVVGARNCSFAGATFTTKICRELGREKIAIVSGLARGIDTAAHLGGLETGTLAILAGGPDRIYPENNRNLYHSIIAKGGAILSENRMGAAPISQSFHARNRLIAGISPALMVMEAALKSGSLVTARFACEYNREVFSVPGHPSDPRSEGTNLLIKKGANMLQSLKDLDFECLYQQESPPEIKREPMKETDLLAAISQTPTSLEELAARLQKDVAEVRSEVTALELQGLVELSSGHSVSRCQV